jgi:hypothetical protein
MIECINYFEVKKRTKRVENYYYYRYYCYYYHNHRSLLSHYQPRTMHHRPGRPAHHLGPTGG